MPYQGMFLCHSLAADRQRQRDSGQQTFGYDRDGDADSEQEPVRRRHSDKERYTEETRPDGDGHERDDA